MLRAIADQSHADFDADPDNVDNQIQLKYDMEFAEVADRVVESFLRQKSRCTWLWEGDMNSGFFMFP